MKSRKLVQRQLTELVDVKSQSCKVVKNSHSENLKLGYRRLLRSSYMLCQAWMGRSNGRSRGMLRGGSI